MAPTIRCGDTNFVLIPCEIPDAVGFALTIESSPCCLQEVDDDVDVGCARANDGTTMTNANEMVTEAISKRRERRRRSFPSIAIPLTQKVECRNCHVPADGSLTTKNNACPHRPTPAAVAILALRFGHFDMLCPW